MIQRFQPDKDREPQRWIAEELVVVGINVPLLMPAQEWRLDGRWIQWDEVDR